MRPLRALILAPILIIAFAAASYGEEEEAPPSEADRWAPVAREFAKGNSVSAVADVGEEGLSKAEADLAAGIMDQPFYKLVKKVQKLCRRCGTAKKREDCRVAVYETARSLQEKVKPTVTVVDGAYCRSAVAAPAGDGAEAENGAVSKARARMKAARLRLVKKADAIAQGLADDKADSLPGAPATASQNAPFSDRRFPVIALTFDDNALVSDAKLPELYALLGEAQLLADEMNASILTMEPDWNAIKKAFPRLNALSAEIDKLLASAGLAAKKHAKSKKADAKEFMKHYKETKTMRDAFVRSAQTVHDRSGAGWAGLSDNPLISAAELPEIEALLEEAQLLADQMSATLAAEPGSKAVSGAYPKLKRLENEIGELFRTKADPAAKKHRKSRTADAKAFRKEYKELRARRGKFTRDAGALHKQLELKGPIETEWEDLDPPVKGPIETEWEDLDPPVKGPIETEW